MPSVFETTVFWSLVVVQLMGLFSVVFSRLTERCRARQHCQCLLYLSLVIVGAATVVALKLGIGYSLCCGTTLSLMGIGATLDMTRSSAAAF